MSTKNLSRTVMEEGRFGYDREQRDYSSHEDRAQNRHFLNQITSLVDPDDAGPEPKRRKVRKYYHGSRVGAINRWIESQVGRKWDDAFSELTRKFDIRSFRGHRTIIEYVTRRITLKPTDAIHESQLSRSMWRTVFYYVDEKGLLRCDKTPSHGPQRAYDGKHLEAKIQKWANERMVMDYGTSIFWMLPEFYEWTKCGYRDHYGSRHWYPIPSGRCFREHEIRTEYTTDYRNIWAMTDYEKTRRGLFFEPVGNLLKYSREEKVRYCVRGAGNNYKQGPRFSQEDLEMWRSLHEEDRRNLLWVKPLR
jgi:hypothetical protein